MEAIPQVCCLAFRTISEVTSLPPLRPFTFSQYYNDSGQYPYFSETIRGTLTDTFIAYGLPSWNICTIFRPFVWGYLLFGPARGLSFFWVVRLLALFLVSFEFAMVYTKGNKWLSLAAGMLIAFAPTVQWWFCRMRLGRDADFFPGNAALPASLYAGAGNEQKDHGCDPDVLVPGRIYFCTLSCLADSLWLCIDCPACVRCAGE